MLPAMQEATEQLTLSSEAEGLNAAALRAEAWAGEPFLHPEEDPGAVLAPGTAGPSGPRPGGEQALPLPPSDRLGQDDRRRGVRRGRAHARRPDPHAPSPARHPVPPRADRRGLRRPLRGRDPEGRLTQAVA